jgi:hypothetical protein
MTNDEAKAIIRKEYLCVDRDCDIERSCGKCDLMMPSKEPILEAYKMAMEALEEISHLVNRPCEACEFHGENGCCKWECVFKGV